ncbi:MAG: dihydropteroate synthase [Coriobacteriia bacterium]
MAESDDTGAGHGCISGDLAGRAGRVWRCGEHRFPRRPPFVIGILNVTPDSFSDGGRFVASDGTVDAVSAVAAGLALAADGASIVDVGGESTRPGAEEVPVETELARVLPVVRELAAAGVAVSIDTRRAPVAEACVKAGASVINDISGFRDPEMVRVAVRCKAGVVVMHMLSEPATMQDDPRYDDVTSEVAKYLLGRVEVLESEGVAPYRVAIDPGLGFGKTAEHNLELLRRLPRLVGIGLPIIVGASRKRFVGAVLGGEATERLEGSLAVAAYAVSRGASAVRVHDVSATVKVVRMVDAIEHGTVT